MTKPFWKTKTLQEMTTGEWESLCDGCALCCMIKIEDDETGDTYYSDLACRLLNVGTGRCSDYPNRKKRVPECLQLTPDNVDEFTWLPPSCAYKKIAAGMDLSPWHPLVSGRAESVHEAGISMLDGAVSEDDADDYSELRLIVRSGD